jgi:hypothetical protein
MSDSKLPPELPEEPAKAPGKPRDLGMECLLGNVALPGFGTCSAGSRKTGITQIVSAMIGFLLTNAFAVWFVKYWMQTGRNPAEVMAESYSRTGMWPTDETRWVLIGLGGVALFSMTFIWGMVFAFSYRQRLRVEKLKQPL